MWSSLIPSSAIFTFFAKILSLEPRWLLVAVSVRLHLVEAGEGEGEDSVYIQGEWGAGKAVIIYAL